MPYISVATCPSGNEGSVAPPPASTTAADFPVRAASRTVNTDPRHRAPKGVDDGQIAALRRNFGVVISSEVRGSGAICNISVSYGMASGLLSPQ